MKNPLSISLYIHIPFCVKKCHYCDFYSIPYNESLADDFIEALLLEWKLVKKKHSLENVSIDTIYFGGGTPSIFTMGQWKKIVECLIKKLSFAKGYEWSIECNPDSFSIESASFWLDSGATRLSFGIQSLIDKELLFLGRVHNAKQALDALNSPSVERFKSVGADLMYGLPGQTTDSLHITLDTILSLPVVRHLSAYELTIGERTRFGKHRSLLPLPAEETDAAMTESILRQSREHGFKRYEISNFSLPGHRCKHNEAYWRHRPYIGLGPAAHSYMPPRRRSNAALTDRYIELLRDRTLPIDFEETVDAKALAREMIFLGLRTAEGVNEADFKSNAGLEFASLARMPLLEKFVQNGMIEHTAPFWRLTERGMLFADGIASELF